MHVWNKCLKSVTFLLVFVVEHIRGNQDALSPLFLDLTGEHFSPDSATVQLLMSQARIGSARAQYYVALVYLYGLQNVEQDIENALLWLRKAALADSIHAQTALATLYVQGEVVGRDYAVAEAYYKKAALQGDSVAQWLLGRLFYDGTIRGGRDFQEALRWFNESATQGNAKGQVYLGMMYEYGLGIDAPRFDQAVEFYTLSSLQGDAEAQFYLGVCYLHGRGVRQGFEKGATLMKASAKQGFPSAMHTLAKLFIYGQGVEVDYEAALQWFTRAAHSEDSTVAKQSQNAQAQLKDSIDNARASALAAIKQITGAA